MLNTHVYHILTHEWFWLYVYEIYGQWLIKKIVRISQACRKWLAYKHKTGIRPRWTFNKVWRECLSAEKIIKTDSFLTFPPFSTCTTLSRLRPHSESLLRFCAVWNTNARNCLNAQAVLQVLLTHLPPEELLQYQGARTHLEGLIPYTGQQRPCVCVCVCFKWHKCHVSNQSYRPKLL